MLIRLLSRVHDQLKDSEKFVTREPGVSGDGRGPGLTRMDRA